MGTKPLYRIFIRNAFNPDGTESAVCKQCADHARWIAEQSYTGTFKYLDTIPEGPGGFTNWPVSTVEGDCPDCAPRREAEARIVASMERVPVSRVRGTIS